MKNPKKPFIGLYLYEPSEEKQGDLKDLLDIVTEAEDNEIYKQHRDRIVIINTGPISTSIMAGLDFFGYFLLQ
jgi:hypothetical protein